MSTPPKYATGRTCSVKGGMEDKLEGDEEQLSEVFEELEATPVSTGIGPQSLPEWAFRARPGLCRICLCPKVSRIAEHKFANR